MSDKPYTDMTPEETRAHRAAVKGEVGEAPPPTFSARFRTGQHLKPQKWEDRRAELIAVCLRYNLPSIVMRDILEAAGETL